MGNVDNAHVRFRDRVTIATVRREFHDFVPTNVAGVVVAVVVVVVVGMVNVIEMHRHGFGGGGSASSGGMMILPGGGIDGILVGGIVIFNHPILYGLCRWLQSQRHVLLWRPWIFPVRQVRIRPRRVRIFNVRVARDIVENDIKGKDGGYQIVVVVVVVVVVGWRGFVPGLCQVS